MMSIRRWTALIVTAAILLVIATVLGVLETSSETFDADPVQVAEPSPSRSASPSSPELPEADLRSALADLCTDNGLEPDGYDWSAVDPVETFNEQKRYLSGRAAAVELRLQAYRGTMLDSGGDNYALSERLMLSSPALFSAYLAAVRTHGESGARAYLADETSHLLEGQPELACEP